MKRWQRVLCAVATAGLLVLACADLDIWPLAWVGFVPLLLALRDTSPRAAFFYGWLAGTLGNAGGFYWIQHLLMRFGGLPWVAAFPIYLLLVAYQGLHWGAFAYAIRRAHLYRPTLPMTLLAPLFMVTAEFLMPFIFDWYLAITQAWVVPAIQVADLTGPLGVTALLMLANGMLYDLLQARLTRSTWPLRPLAIGSALLLLSFGYGALRVHQVRAQRAAAPKVKVGVVQANIGIVQKGRAELTVLHHALHLRESHKLQDQGAELLVWPESSYPYAMLRTMTRDWPERDPRRIMVGLKVPLIFGAVSFEPSSRFPYNTAYMMEPDGRITGRFDKNFLLVFGEYIPLYETFPAFRRWFPAMSHFARGTEVTTFPFRGHRIGPMICYEDILPSFGRRLAPLKPNLLVNVTNDAWFGQTSEPYEHLALAVFRSVEHRLDMVRSVNTGVSAFIDATGRVGPKTRSHDPVLTPGVPPEGLLGEVALLDGARTVYARVGDLFAYLALAGTVALLLWARRTRTTQPAPAKPRGREPRGKRRKR
ncbi:MAG: apolipoprotein N-acyltransferase [Deltaproteobacteria bacterium]|nr:apolipoprotein N-acyltransferase [Deltaproteobacteria bacterium]